MCTDIPTFIGSGQSHFRPVAIIELLKSIDYFAIVSEMTAKIILTSQPSSAKFTDRVLLLDQETVKVSRSTTEEKPDTYNAVFDCRVRKILGR